MKGLPEPFAPSVRIAAGALFRPWALAAAVGLALLPLLWTDRAELGIATHDTHNSGIFYEVAFVASLLGCTLGLRELGTWEAFTSRWQPIEVLLHEATVIVLPTLALSAAPLLAGLPAGSAPSLPALAALSLVLARPVATGLVLRRLPLATPQRVLAMLAACWWIPATLPPSFPLGLGLAPHLALEAAASGALETPGPWVAEISWLLALLLAARLGLGRATQNT